MSISILGLNIKKIREEKGISAYKLSKTARIGTTTVSEIESGKRQSLNTNTIEKIAVALNVTVDDLMASEINKEYIVTDIEQTIALILSSEELVLDDVELSGAEKEQLKTNISLTLQSIRKQREMLQAMGRTKINKE